MGRSNTGLTGACCVHRYLALASVAAQRAPRHPGSHATGISLSQGARGGLRQGGGLGSKDNPTPATTLKGLPNLEEVPGSNQTRERKRIQQFEPIYHEPPEPKISALCVPET